MKLTALIQLANTKPYPHLIENDLPDTATIQDFIVAAQNKIEAEAKYQALRGQKFSLKLHMASYHIPLDEETTLPLSALLTHSKFLANPQCTNINNKLDNYFLVLTLTSPTHSNVLDEKSKPLTTSPATTEQKNITTLTNADLLRDIKEYKTAILALIEMTTSFEKLITIAIYLKKGNLARNSEEYKQFNSALKIKMKTLDFCQISNEQLLYCYIFQNKLLNSLLKQQTMTKLKRLSSQTNPQDEKNKAVSITTSSSKKYTLCMLSVTINHYLTERYEKEVEKLKHLFHLHHFIYSNDEEKVVIQKQCPINQKYKLYLKGHKFDDNFAASLYKRLHHQPNKLNKVLATLYSFTTGDDFKENSELYRSKKSYDKAHKKQRKNSSHILYNRLFEGTNEPQKKANNVTLELNRQIAANTDYYLSPKWKPFLAKLNLFTTGPKALLGLSDKLNNSFFFNLFEHEIFKFLISDPYLYSKEESYLDLQDHYSKRIAEYSKTISYLYDNAISIVEQEYQRLQSSTAGDFQLDGSDKADVLLATLKTIAGHFSTFIRDPQQSIKILHKNTYTTVKNCAENPIIAIGRNETVDILRGLLGVILFIPSFGATYWHTPLYNTFFGAPRSKIALTKATERVHSLAL